jgi:hypothetical protein
LSEASALGYAPADSVVHGPMPYRFFETIRVKFIATPKARRANMVPRGE